MRIELPHRIVRLSEDEKMLPSEEKKKIVEGILQETVTVNNEEMSVEEYFNLTFNIQSTKIAMELLAYFMIKEHKQREDILSGEAMKKMNRGSKFSTNFSDLSLTDKVSLGIDNENDYAN